MRHSGKILVDPQSRRETLEHIAADFPYSADFCDLHNYPGNTFPWHWHREIEIFYLREGRLEYHLPGGVTVFEAGEGGFLNSNVLHQTCCRAEDACLQEEQQFVPELIGGFAGSRIMQKYVLPVVEAPGLELVRLTPEDPAHRPLLEALCRAYTLYDEQPEGFELELQWNLLAFWQGLYHLTAGRRQTESAPMNDRRIKQMLSFIAAHYGEKLELEQIAAAAYLSPRACGRCFQTQLGTTPFAYLTDYRVQRACEQLSATDELVSEIALRCGFGSSSYFGHIFREKTGLSPNEYRKAHRRP